ncbi:MAG: hypothetical protein K9K66_02190 [Desulfarculaceae bacterium]|nr:hypothetical protein [Desulfarculaceae bacterium]MCF8073408.1 hypothetical protein [Desulfarculaceae bacterium]MCF8100445.1 hypothetical protein [Desulfarculaceae bacterium]MCF8115819.1 hypothetical protein [Desulfarculaceae bacterium]
MTRPQGIFGREEMRLLCEGLSVAEDRVSDHFRLSEGFWCRHPFEVRTLAELNPDEVTGQALAQVLKLRKSHGKRLRGKDFWRICFQDHNFLETVQREGSKELFLPLLTYVMVHELVHVVRFCTYVQRFELDQEQRQAEEAEVHRLSGKVLKKVPLPHLDQVLRCYEDSAAALHQGHC